MFGQNVDEHNPAPSPSGHPLLSGPPTLNRYSPDIHPQLWVPSSASPRESLGTLRLSIPMLASATVRSSLANALRLQTTSASRLSAVPARFVSSLAGRRRDPHEVLGVLPGVSKCELKKAFHRSSWSWHPDRATPSDRPAAEVRPGECSKPLAAPRHTGAASHSSSLTAHSLSPRPAASLQGAFGGLPQAERPQ